MRLRRIRHLAAAAPLALVAACATADGTGTDGGTDTGEDGGGPGGADADTTGGPDAAPTCPTQPCDLLEQCGCTSPEVCDLDPQNLPNTACRAVSTPGTDEANCTSFNGCAGGYICLGGGNSQCRRYCADDMDCGEGGYCLIQVQDGNGNPIQGAKTCTKSCTPEAETQNGCPSDPQFGCHTYFDDPDGSLSGADPMRSGDEYWLTDCVSAPATGGGDETDCSEDGDADCAPGFTCVVLTDGSGNSRDVCKEICVVGGAACTAGTCTQYPDNQDGPPRPTIGGTEYGVCI